MEIDVKKSKRRTIKELKTLPPPIVPVISDRSNCPLCRVRANRRGELENAPSLDDILFSGIAIGIIIGKTDPIDEHWCDGCRTYVERSLELANAVRPS